MDLWGIFMVFLFMFVIFSCCGYCCTKKRRGAVLSDKDANNEGVSTVYASDIGQEPVWALTEVSHHTSGDESSTTINCPTGGDNSTCGGADYCSPSNDCSPCGDCCDGGDSGGGCGDFD